MSDHAWDPPGRSISSCKTCVTVRVDGTRGRAFFFLRGGELVELDTEPPCTPRSPDVSEVDVPRLFNALLPRLLDLGAPLFPLDPPEDATLIPIGEACDLCAPCPHDGPEEEDCTICGPCPHGEARNV